MDPVSVFNALFDTKCIKFGKYNLRSGLEAPYYINLRRLPLYPDLMEAIVTQIVEKYLTEPALMVTLSQVAKQAAAPASKQRASADGLMKVEKVADKLGQFNDDKTDSDSQIGEEDLETSSDDCDWDSISDRINDPIICGVPCAGVPLAMAVACKAKMPFLLDRKENKSYGDSELLIADYNDETRNAYPTCQEARKVSTDKQPRIILIEDVICSGLSILESVSRLEKQGIKVELVICIVDRDENGANLLLEKAGIRVVSLYKISAILRVLEITGRISHEDFMSIKKWINSNQHKYIGIKPDTPVSPVISADLRSLQTSPILNPQLP